MNSEVISDKLEREIDSFFPWRRTMGFDLIFRQFYPSELAAFYHQTRLVIDQEQTIDFLFERGP